MALMALAQELCHARTTFQAGQGPQLNMRIIKLESKHNRAYGSLVDVLLHPISPTDIKCNKPILASRRFDLRRAIRKAE
jgi:hypothetical protein